MRRRAVRGVQVCADLTVLTLAFLLAGLIRFDWDPPSWFLPRLFSSLPVFVGVQYVLLRSFGIPRFSWRFIGMREVVRILLATSLASGLLLTLRMVLNPLRDAFPTLTLFTLPIGVILINYILAFCAVTGVRVLRRLLGERAASNRHRDSDRGASVPLLLIGAGQGGFLVAREIVSREDLGFRPVGFVDDDVLKHGSVIHGIPVLGGSADLKRIVASTGAREALITISAAPGSVVREIRDRCRAVGLTVKLVPGLYDIVGGKVNLSRIRSVRIEDLLRREPVNLDVTAIRERVGGRCVMVTGAGGSIGSELCRQLLRFEPSPLLLVERSENALFEIHRELSSRFPDLDIRPCLADVCDEERIDALLRDQRPAVVFHAAAHKHVPMMEWNPGEAVKNNVQGTRTVADLASRHGVEDFVMVSTDKAVNPTSVMGTSKRCAELYIQALSNISDTRFSTVRFGNVLGSAGSVVPIFQEQIRRGGPVTVTHPEMTRYFMTIPEACQLVTQAAALSDTGGQIFVLDMGEPVRIVDLARDLIHLCGFEVDEDIEIRFSGVRPGEKLFEELSVDGEDIERTQHPKIFIGRYGAPRMDSLRPQLDMLLDSALRGDEEGVREALREIVPEYVSPQRTESGTKPINENERRGGLLRPALQGA